MRDYLILKLTGPLQAWGKETFEGLRPSELFPTRSALLGLLGACLGIERNDQTRLKNLALSVGFAVRVGQQCQKMTDYHTVKNARKDYRGLSSHDTIQTWREYWQDAVYTVAVWEYENAPVSLSDIESALKQPLYTPVLGRRSCPMTRPLFEAQVSEDSVLAALAYNGSGQGTIYSDEDIPGHNTIPLKKRDVPIIHQSRQFASRIVYMTAEKGDGHVFE
ncbi:type I-E CRISPR-associated protein Cas5/CasD [Nitrosomonas sp. Nm166]|uniref:type I-E CRISPR-associated protein Cas5/CasD n=1 Tax=Nitrosomonas sp. Nm166 TaxID=1881054 RepID=UPI0008EE1215|nr:type I-E CRISPR-associated protein Cas5/CasD [Nitrosomonas sp. Nm166]SFF01883.1 CRISPR system Cascade subunit CasD [Nitrosomonas sp. Nm166]